jgi:hypothetical protein
MKCHKIIFYEMSQNNFVNFQSQNSKNYHDEIICNVTVKFYELSQQGLRSCWLNCSGQRGVIWFPVFVLHMPAVLCLYVILWVVTAQFYELSQHKFYELSQVWVSTVYYQYVPGTNKYWVLSLSTRYKQPVLYRGGAQRSRFNTTSAMYSASSNRVITIY